MTDEEWVRRMLEQTKARIRVDLENLATTYCAALDAALASLPPRELPPERCSPEGEEVP